MRTSDTMLVGSMIFGFVCSFGCSDSLAEVSDNMGELVSANNAFGFNVFQQLVGKNMSGNIFMSPTGLAMALSMTYNGAGGETQEAMARILEQHPELEKKWLGPLPMRHMGEPEDIAYMILFLASDEAKFITGQEYSVNGGSWV